MSGQRCLWLVVLALAAAATGCWQKREQMAAPPAPLPPFLSQEAAAQPTGGGATPAKTEPAANASAGAATQAASMTPEDIVRKVAELNEALTKMRLVATESPEAGGPRHAGASSPAAPQTGPAAQEARIGQAALTGIEPADESTPPKTLAAPSGIQTAPEAPTAVAGGTAASPEPALAQLIRLYEQKAGANPTDVKAARNLRLLHFLAGEDEKCLQDLPGLPADEQSLWRGLMWTLVNVRDRTGAASPPAQAAEVLTALNDVRAAAQKLSPLELGDVRFCERINGFGDYLPRPGNRFRPNDSLRLYGEIRNFASLKGDDGLYRVRLCERLALETPDGQTVWQQTFDNIEDTCRRPRQDFFLTTTTRLAVPPQTAPGKYALRVTVEDKTSGKSAAVRLDLELAAPGSTE